MPYAVSWRDLTVVPNNGPQANNLAILTDGEKKLNSYN